MTKDPETRVTTNNMCISRFTVAVDRKIKKENEPNADFINCTAFSKTGEFIDKWFTKGMKIGLTGHIQTGSYTNKDGFKVYTTEVIVDECEFLEKKGDAEERHEDFQALPEGLEEELPFSQPGR